MTTAIILIVSGILIGAGISIIWRDARARRRRAFVQQARRSRQPPIPRPRPRSPSPTTPSRPGAAAAACRDRRALRPPLTSTSRARPRPLPGAPSPRAPVCTSRSSRSGPTCSRRVAAGVDKINAVLAPVRLLRRRAPASRPGATRTGAMAPTVACCWTARAWRGCGSSCRPTARLHASVKAHKDDRAEINAAADAPAKGLNAASASDLLAKCLSRRRATRRSRQPGGDNDEAASEQAWQDDRRPGLGRAQGHQRRAGADRRPAASARARRLGGGAAPPSHDVVGRGARRRCRAHAHRAPPHEMEVAVGVREPQLIDLGRRRRVPVEGMTIHALAELIASCAWPAIARFREARRPA